MLFTPDSETTISRGTGGTEAYRTQHFDNFLLSSFDEFLFLFFLIVSVAFKHQHSEFQYGSSESISESLTRLTRFLSPLTSLKCRLRFFFFLNRSP